MWKRLALTLLWWNVCYSSSEWWHSMESGSASHEKTDHWDLRDNREPFEVYLKLRNEPEVAKRKVKPAGPLFTTAKPDSGEAKTRNRCVLHLICEDPDCGELCELCGSSSNEQHESDYSSSISEEAVDSGKTEKHPTKSVKSFKPKDEKLARDKTDEAKPKSVQTNSKSETNSVKHADQSEKSSTEPPNAPVRKQTFPGRGRILPKIVNRLRKFKKKPKPTVSRTTAAPNSWEQDQGPGKDDSLNDKGSPKSTISAKLRNNDKWEVNDAKQYETSHITVRPMATTTSKLAPKKEEFRDKDSLETLSSEMHKDDHDDSFHKWKGKPTSPKPRESDKHSDKQTKVVNERHSSEVSKLDRHKVIHGNSFEHKRGETAAPKKSPEVPKAGKHSEEQHDSKEQMEGKHTSSKSHESDSKKIKLLHENPTEPTNFDKQKKAHDGKSGDSKPDPKKDEQQSDDSLQFHNLADFVKVSHYTDSSSSENMVLLKDGTDPKAWPYVVAKLVQTELETAHMIIKQKPIKSALLNLKDSLKPVLIATSKTLSKIFATDAGELAKKAGADGGTTVGPPATTISVPVAVPNRSAVKTPGDSRKRKRGRQRQRPLSLRRAVKGKLIAMRTQQPPGTGADPEVDLLANGCSCKCPALKSGAKVRHDRIRLAALRRGG